MFLFYIRAPAHRNPIAEGKRQSLLKTGILVICFQNLTQTRWICLQEMNLFQFVSYNQKTVMNLCRGIFMKVFEVTVLAQVL